MLIQYIRSYPPYWRPFLPPERKDAPCTGDRDALIGHKRDEVKGEWRKLHNDELNDLYSSPNIVWVIKSRRMRGAGNVACMGEERGL